MMVFSEIYFLFCVVVGNKVDCVDFMILVLVSWY